MSRRVVLVLPSFGGGGAERVMLTLARHLDRSAFAPVLLVVDGRGPLSAEVPPDVPVYDLRSGRLRYALFGLATALRGLRPSIVISSIGYVNLALIALRPFLRRRTRIFIREANTPSVSLAASHWPRLFHCGYRILYPRADGVVCSSRRMLDEMKDNIGVSSARLYLVMNPVDVCRIRTAVQVPERFPGTGRRFVAVGRLTRQKGFDRLLQLLARLPGDTHLTLLGEGNERKRLVAMAHTLGVEERVQFAGFCANPWPLLAGADAFLLSSRWEGMPNAALEALACGTPVIAMKEAGGIGDVAALTTVRAVRLAGDEDEFLQLMREVDPKPVSELRPSLLPAEFEPEAVARRYSEMFSTGYLISAL